MRVIFSIAAALLTLAAVPAAWAQDGMVLRVGQITTKQSCAYFQGSAGKAEIAADRIAISWRTWWVKDCAANFASMRSTLEAALASSGTLRVGARGARYSVSINITGISGGEGPAPVTPDADRYSITRTLMIVSMDVSVHDQSGRAVFGGLVTRKIEVGSDAKIDGFRATSNASGEAAYGKMQNELALAAARMVVFHFAPIEVISADGKQVQLNHGTPLVELGSLVLIASPDRRAVIRYRVTSANAGFALAQVDGSGNFASIVPGSIGTFVDPDDPQANGRRYQKVDLP